MLYYWSTTPMYHRSLPYRSVGKQIEALVLVGLPLVGSIPVQTNTFLHLILLLIQRGSLLRLYILSKCSPDSFRRTEPRTNLIFMSEPYRTQRIQILHCYHGLRGCIIKCWQFDAVTLACGLNSNWQSGFEGFLNEPRKWRRERMARQYCKRWVEVRGGKGSHIFRRRPVISRLSRRL